MSQRDAGGRNFSLDKKSLTTAASGQARSVWRQFGSPVSAQLRVHFILPHADMLMSPDVKHPVKG